MTDAPPPGNAVAAFLAPYNEPVREIALRLRRLILSIAPDLIEQIDEPARMLAYGFDRSYRGTVCVLMPLKQGANLGFARGAELPDPAGLLAGTGKRARHVRISDVAQVDAPELLDLLEAAIIATPRSEQA